MVGWVVAAAIGAGVFVTLTVIDKFWNSIAGWLNNTAANAVEKVLGYKASQNMKRAVGTITKIRDKLNNNSIIYTKRDYFDTTIEKVTLTSSAPFYDQEQEVRELFEREQTQTQEFVYKG